MGRTISRRSLRQPDLPKDTGHSPWYAAARFTRDNGTRPVDVLDSGPGNGAIQDKKCEWPGNGNEVMFALQEELESRTMHHLTPESQNARYAPPIRNDAYTFTKRRGTRAERQARAASPGAALKDFDLGKCHFTWEI
ncbi:hypothetical protein BD410DRAFT_824123 [Rickenella mellea]|uniref:Uncharacterized protein n=1 Tax=Rickenella mellea TaxID=50990 RepID=A0A4Y7QLQ7_9AGAM|nr:hypothetical protein BD410DRAFT_824123 [Rickenella mellea]